MRLGRPKVALILTDDERVRLDSLAYRARTAPHLARRARIILACAEGTDNKVVAKRLRMSQTTVPRPFHPDLWLLAELGRALVCGIDEQAIAPRSAPQCRAARSRHSGIHRRAPCESQTLRLDQNR
jgi:hypothetical protein